jgi:hypothetical protein
MSNSNQKSELTWIDKEIRSKLELRILLEDPAIYNTALAMENELHGKGKRQ